VGRTQLRRVKILENLVNNTVTLNNFPTLSFENMTIVEEKKGKNSSILIMANKEN